MNALGGQYKTNFDKAAGEAISLRDKMIQENKTVYYESETPLDECPKPDPTNFVKTIDVKATLDAASPLDQHFRHLIPPAVRQMQDELKNMLQAIISEQFNKVQTCNDQLNTFLK